MSITDSPKLRDLVLTCDQKTDLPDEEIPDAMIRRILIENTIHEVNEKTHWYFLREVHPPHWYNGNMFAFAEGQEPLRIHWQYAQRYFCRQLTREQSDQFCEAVGLAKTYEYYGVGDRIET